MPSAAGHGARAWFYRVLALPLVLARPLCQRDAVTGAHSAAIASAYAAASESLIALPASHAAVISGSSDSRTAAVGATATRSWASIPGHPNLSSIASAA